MQADKILKLVRLSEKSNKLSSELGQYTFEVYGHANKHQIAEAVEQTFKVTVRRVISVCGGSAKRKGKSVPSISRRLISRMKPQPGISTGEGDLANNCRANRASSALTSTA